MTHIKDLKPVVLEPMTRRAYPTDTTGCACCRIVVRLTVECAYCGRLATPLQITEEPK